MARLDAPIPNRGGAMGGAQEREFMRLGGEAEPVLRRDQTFNDDGVQFPSPQGSDAELGRRIPTSRPVNGDTREQEGFMRRLILQTGISIDGYVAALDKSHPWGVEGEDEGIKRWVLDSVWAAGAHLMGRVT